MVRTDHFHNPNAPAPNSIVVAVTTFVRDETGKVLLIRRTDNDLYAIPGGAVELGEMLTEAARRETMEETGIAIEVTGLVGVFSNPHHLIEFTDGEVRQEFSICFRAKPTGGTLRTSGESKEVLWTAPADLDTHYPIQAITRPGLLKLQPHSAFLENKRRLFGPLTNKVTIHVVGEGVGVQGFPSTAVRIALKAVSPCLRAVET